MNNNFDISYVLEELKKRRKVFNSEADFQFALAWTIKEIYKDLVDVRLEYSVMLDEKTYNYIDIVLFFAQKYFIPIELKYKTKAVNILDDMDNSNFYLRNQGATDLGKFFYLLDIERMESFREIYGYSKGYCILITNDKSYTKKTIRNTKNKAFSIGNDEMKTGLLTWREDSSIFQNKHIKESIELEGTYRMKWDVFHDFNQGSNSVFYILVNEVLK